MTVVTFSRYCQCTRHTRWTTPTRTVENPARTMSEALIREVDAELRTHQEQAHPGQPVRNWMRRR